MTSMREWCKLPSQWIEDQGLHKLRWGSDGLGSSNTAALITLAIIAHHADVESGVALLTYDQLAAASGLSRAKISDGLDILSDLDLIERAPHGRSTFRIVKYEVKSRWAQLPAKRLYVGDKIPAFYRFTLRTRCELNAMKLYFLFAARRDTRTNTARISFDKIVEYSKLARSDIKPATSLLAATGLIYVEHLRSTLNENGVSNGYRLVGLHPRMHMGTIGFLIDGLQY